MIDVDKIVPLGSRVLAKREEDEMERNGIIIPDQYRESNQFAVVHAVGKDTQELQPGDRIITKKHWGEGIKVAEGFFIIKEDEVLGYVRKD